MANVLKADHSAADAYVDKTVAFPAGGWYLQFKLAVPDATMASIVAVESGSNNCYTAYLVRVLDSLTNVFVSCGCGDSLGDAAGLTSPATFFSQPGGYSPGGVFASDTWHTVIAHYDGTHVIWTLDGTAVITATPFAVTAELLRVGANGGDPHSSEIYYFADVRVGTTLGGTDVFSDDFSSGDISVWDTSSGSVSVVADPGYPDATVTDDTTTFSGPVRVGVAFSSTALDTTPTWTYLTEGSSRVASYSIDRGRQFEFDKTDAGTATVQINDRDGTLDPTNTAGPYFGLIEPLLQIRLELWNPVALEYQTRFRGWIEDYDYVIDPGAWHQDASGNTLGVTRLQISCVDIFAILTAIEMQPDGTFGDTPPTTPVDVSGNIYFPNEDARTRIDGVMFDASVATDFYVAFTLNVNLQASVYSPSENVLQVIQDAADAEFPTVSNVYTDRFGRLAVHGRLAKFDPFGTAAGADWDLCGGNGVPWKAGDGAAVTASPADTAHIRTFAYNRGLSKIINSALCTPNGIDDTNKTTVTGADIASLYYSDLGSIGQFGFRSWSAENLLLGAPSGELLTATGAGILTGNSAMDECLAFSTYIVENYKAARNRITDCSFRSIAPGAEGAAANWDMLCKVDISDVVAVTIRGPGDTSTAYIFNAEEFFVEGVHEEAKPANPEYADVTLTLDLSPKAYFPIGGGGGVGVT